MVKVVASHHSSNLDFRRSNPELRRSNIPAFHRIMQMARIMTLIMVLPPLQLKTRPTVLITMNPNIARTGLHPKILQKHPKHLLDLTIMKLR